MAAEHVQGLETDVLDQLASKHGPQWEELFVQRWGANWAQPCKEELDSYLGQGWEGQPADTKSEALSVLIAPSAEPEAGSNDDPEAYPSLTESPWITSITEVSTFEEWLTRIGVDAALVDSLAKSGPPSSSESANSDSPDAIPSLDDSPWISTILATTNFAEWLTRIGVDAAVVDSLAKSAEAN